MNRRGMRRQGRMSRVFVLLGTLMGFGVGAAYSEPLDTEVVATCMFDNATQADKDVIKKLVVAALTDDVGSIKGLQLLVASGITRIAMDPCKVTVEQLGQPEMMAAVKIYSENVGKQMMEEAFAKLK
jgi:hypothetical protein